MEAIIAIFRESFETLKRFPQLFAFPALCWIAGLILQTLLDGFLLTPMSRGFSLATAALGFASLAAIMVQLVAAYFSAGQVKGLLLAANGKALTPALFADGYNKCGGRVLSAKLLRVGLLLGVGLVGGLLTFVLSLLGTLIGMLAAASVALATLFWEVIIVRDDAQIQPALASTYQLVTKNLAPVCLPMIVLVVGQSIVTSVLGYIPGIGSFLSSLFSQVLIAPFAGLIVVNLLAQVTSGQTAISG